MKMHRSARLARTLALLAFAVGAAAPSLVAQGTVPAAPPAAQAPARAAPVSAATTPEEFGRIYIRSIVSGDFAETAKLMHPLALSSIHRFVTALTARDSSGDAMRQLAGTSDRAELAKMSDAQVYERFLKATMGAQPGFQETMRSATADVIGHVDETGGLTHVIYRLKFSVDGTDLRKMDVLSLKRDGAEWRAMLTGDIENLITRMSAAGH